MKVSIIISTYNRPHYLERVISGYLHQSHAPGEIVIADDGSAEDTALMIKEIQKTTKVKIIHTWHEDRGFRISQIRNRAIAKSTGEYLIICDDDSVPCISMVEDHMKYSEEGHFIQGHRVLLRRRVSEVFTCKDTSFIKLLTLSITGQASNVLNALRLPVPLISISRKLKGIRSCNMSFFRKDFIAVNGFNEDFEGWGKEDSELAVRFYKYGLQRKDIKFRACCYHLYHEYNSRENVGRNAALLEISIKSSDYFCKIGIDKYLS